jgi:hypothetical protein
VEVLEAGLLDPPADLRLLLVIDRERDVHAQRPLGAHHHGLHSRLGTGLREL